ncbi:ribonuclease P protein component [Acidovorax sp. NCPPB 2350]|nr:ribonuclease P protein component [Acidovorax sp. NCPPB 2350]
MQRLKTRPQFQAAMAGGTISRTAHFALHRLRLGAGAGRPAAGTPSAPDAPPASHATGPGALPFSGQAPQALFGVDGEAHAWLGAMVPKRWARRAVTRNTIKRQIYAVGSCFEPGLGAAAHVVRLRAAFDRKQFPSATSEALKHAVRAELLQLFGQGVRKPGAVPRVTPAATDALPSVPGALQP